MKALSDVDWLIWSHEHYAWWRPARMGYTYDVEQAGRYSLEEASQICSDANCYLRPGSVPNEVMTPAPEHMPMYVLTGRRAEDRK